MYSKETEKKLGTYPKWEHLEKQKKNSLKNCELGVVVKMPVFHVRNDWICVWLHFWSKLSAEVHPGKQSVMAQAAASLLPTPLAPDIGLAQPQLIQPSEEWTSWLEISVSLSLSPLPPSLSAFQMN